MKRRNLLAALATFLVLAFMGWGLSRYYDYQRRGASFDHWMRGEELSRAGHKEAAIAELLESLRLDPHRSAHYDLARIYRKQGRITQAMTEYRMIIDQESRKEDKTGAASAHYELGKLLNAQGRYDEAQTEWRAAIVCAPINVPQQASIYDVHAKAERALAENPHRFPLSEVK